MQNFTNGVNLGGWLSQYPRYDHEHFKTFITRPDIEQIAAWGFDHIRLPVDYPVLESDDAPGVYRKDGFQYIDSCLEWCKTTCLGVVFDLHHAPGYSFNNTLKPETQHLNVLFDQPEAQLRFIALWETIVCRYHNAGLPIIFELLNEVVLPESAPWNALAHKTVAALRHISPDCRIMIGGTNYSAASELKNIARLDDPNVLYTFHFYEPLLFTHQKAPWVQAAAEYNQELEYPGLFTNLAAFIQRNPHYQESYGWQADCALNRALVREFLIPVFDFIAESGHIPYCGEYGVIDTAPVASRRAWHADLLAIFNQRGIGRAVWSYKEMNFSLVNHTRQVTDSALIKILSGK
jgi:endoglucanase